MNVTLPIPAFTDEAACNGADPEMFFPPAEQSGAGPAKQICAGCPVRDACLTYALDYEADHPGSRWGVYGGTTARQRRTMTTKQRTKP